MGDIADDHYDRFCEDLAPDDDDDFPLFAHRRRAQLAIRPDELRPITDDVSDLI